MTIYRQAYKQHLETSIAAIHKSDQTMIHHKAMHLLGLPDSHRLFINNFRKQSFQHTPRSLILATGRFRASMQ